MINYIDKITNKKGELLNIHCPFISLQDGIVPSYTPPGDFPTPKLLADCQDEYIQLYEENKIRTTDNAGRESGIVPSPQPFRTRKVEIFTRENYVDIEAGRKV